MKQYKTFFITVIVSLSLLSCESDKSSSSEELNPDAGNKTEGRKKINTVHTYEINNPVPPKNNPELNAQLLESATAGNANEISRLLRLGADVNAKTKNSLWTALHWASRYGHTAVVRLLIQNGANVNAKTFDDWTALHWASKYGHIETVKLLAANGANVNAKNNRGKTALDIARDNGHTNIF